ncbi:HAD family hydrolase [Spirosoma knui]
MNYKLVIFDFDGTLADSFPYFLRTVNVLARQYNFEQIELDQVDQLRGLDARQMMKHSKLPAWKIPFVARSFIRLMAQDIDQITLFADIPALLEQLSAQGVQLAIVSSNSAENVRRVLGPRHAALINHYECGSALFGKPRKFKRVVTKSGVTSAETLCIGDELRDIEAASKASLTFGGVAWGYTRADILQAQSNTLFFATVDEILSTVLGDSGKN